MSDTFSDSTQRPRFWGVGRRSGHPFRRDGDHPFVYRRPLQAFYHQHPFGEEEETWGDDHRDHGEEATWNVRGGWGHDLLYGGRPDHRDSDHHVDHPDDHHGGNYQGHFAVRLK